MTPLEAQLRRAFPVAVAHEVVALAELDWTAQHPFRGPFVVAVDRETLQIPERIYTELRTLDAARHLASGPRRLALYLFTRHHDGYVRQACLEELLGAHDAWAPAYVLRLLGEPVYEVIESIHQRLASIDHAAYARFIAANPAFYELTRQRVRSYWNAYRRRTPFADSCGARVLAVLDAHRAE